MIIEYSVFTESIYYQFTSREGTVQKAWAYAQSAKTTKQLQKILQAIQKQWQNAILHKSNTKQWQNTITNYTMQYNKNSLESTAEMF